MWVLDKSHISGEKKIIRYNILEGKYSILKPKLLNYSSLYTNFLDNLNACYPNVNLSGKLPGSILEIRTWILFIYLFWIFFKDLEVQASIYGTTGK